MMRIKPSAARAYIALSSAASVVAVASTAHAQATQPSVNPFFNSIGGTAPITSAGFGNRSLGQTITSLIQVTLGFLGLIAFFIILFGGFKWMLSQGDETKIKSAKKLMVSGVIGMLIILSAWALVTFVLQSLVTATGTSPT